MRDVIGRRIVGAAAFEAGAVHAAEDDRAAVAVDDLLAGRVKRADDPRRPAGCGLEHRVVDVVRLRCPRLVDGQLQDADQFPKECCLFLLGLNQGHLDILSEHGKRDSGKASA